MAWCSAGRWCTDLLYMWSTTMTVFFLSSSPFILAEKSNMENVLLEFSFSQKNVEKKQEAEVQFIFKKVTNFEKWHSVSVNSCPLLKYFWDILGIIFWGRKLNRGHIMRRCVLCTDSEMICYPFHRSEVCVWMRVTEAHIDRSPTSPLQTHTRHISVLEEMGQLRTACYSSAWG